MYTANPHAYDLRFDWAGKTWAVPEWFANRELSPRKMLAIRNSGNEDGDAVSETSKALRVRWMVEYGSVSLWVPKSVLVSPDELRDSARKAAERRDKNDRYYQYLRNLAKDNGVRLGSVRKWDKIKAKLDDAGVGYVEYGDFDESLETGDDAGRNTIDVDGIVYEKVERGAGDDAIDFPEVDGWRLSGWVERVAHYSCDGLPLAAYFAFQPDGGFLCHISRDLGTGSRMQHIFEEDRTLVTDPVKAIEEILGATRDAYEDFTDAIEDYRDRDVAYFLVDKYGNAGDDDLAVSAETACRDMLADIEEAIDRVAR